MHVVLIILGILGSGAIVIATYVFTAAARNYDAKNSHSVTTSSARSKLAHQTVRCSADRRSGRPVTFPLAVDGKLIANDRRILTDRRSRV